MSTYVNPFTGQTISPTATGYELLLIDADTPLQWPVNGNNNNVVANTIQVIASVAGLNVLMPSAQQVGTGQSVLIQNIGTESFTVTDISGNTIITIASGVAEYIFLVDNTTDDGIWSSVTFGAGTSSANASALAGYGLTAINTTLNQAYQTTSIYSDFTLDTSYRAQFLVWESGVGTVTLPSSATVGNNWFVMIRNGGTGVLTVTPSGTNTIDDTSFVQLQPTESFVVVADGISGYNSFARGRSATLTYTQLAKTVTGGTVTLTPVEYANVVQEYIGTLTSDCYVVLPSTVQIYYLNNLTSGSYNLIFKTAAVGAATVNVPQGQTITVICDGTNVFNANTVISGSIASLTINSGSAGTPAINFTGDTSTGIYHPATSQVAISLAGVNAATFTTTGLIVVAGIGGGNF